MKKIVLKIFLIISSIIILNGCSFFSPFKSVTSCSDAKNNGAMCASLESNLLYAEQYGSNKTVLEEDSKKEDKNKKKKDNDKETSLPIVHNDTLVARDELVRIITELNIKNNINNEPVLIPASTYKIFIMPYQAEEKFYSGRSIFITAGKSKWLMGNYVVSKGHQIRLGKYNETQEIVEHNLPSSNNILNNNINIIEKKISDDKTESINSINTIKENKQYRVIAYYLNCRTKPTMNSPVTTVLKLKDTITILDTTKQWWLINANGKECYVNSKYLSDKVQELQ